MALIKKNGPSSGGSEMTGGNAFSEKVAETIPQNGKTPQGTKDGRYRYWTVVVYPESAPKDWRDRLHGLQWVESPLHDKDVNPDGTPKKAHWHIMIFNSGKISYSQAKEIADSVNGASPQYVKNMTGMVRYFAHLDNPEKAQYQKSEIKGHGVDVSKILETEDDIDKLEQEIEMYCEDNNVTEYAQLIRVSRQFDGWHKCVSTHTVHFKAFVASLRHSSLAEKSASSVLATQEADDENN